MTESNVSPIMPYSDDEEVNPEHYQGDGIECIEAIEAAGCGIDFCRGSIIKYTWRLYGKETPLKNARKIAWYAERLIMNLEKDLPIEYRGKK